MKKLPKPAKAFAIFLSCSTFCFFAQAEPAHVKPSPSPQPKSVQTQVDSNPEKIDVVGVQASDPAQNGKPVTNGILSPTNASSMGVGIQLHFGGPAKTSEKNDTEDEQPKSKP